MEIQRLKEEIKSVNDPRRAYGNLRHKLEEIIVIGLMTIVCIGEDFTDMENFGLERLEWLKTFLELPYGIPDSDTFRRVYERINPRELSCCLNNWLAVSREKGTVVGIDGKTIRGSGNADHKAYHVVSAWAAENRITLGQTKVNKKSNEIAAIPELLDMLDIEGCVVTIDAMGCQKDIVKKITDKTEPSVLALHNMNKPSHNHCCGVWCKRVKNPFYILWIEKMAYLWGFSNYLLYYLNYYRRFFEQLTTQ